MKYSAILMMCTVALTSVALGSLGYVTNFEGSTPLAGWGNNPQAYGVPASPIADNGPSMPGVQAIDVAKGSLWKGSINIIPGQKFTVKVDYKIVGTMRPTGATGFYYDIQYWQGTTLKSTLANQFASVTSTNNWFVLNKEFTPAAGADNITFVFRAHYAQTTEAGTLSIDNFQVIPEPATLAILGCGSLLLLRKRR